MSDRERNISAAVAGGAEPVSAMNGAFVSALNPPIWLYALRKVGPLDLQKSHIIATVVQVNPDHS